MAVVTLDLDAGRSVGAGGKINRAGDFAAFFDRIAPVAGEGEDGVARRRGLKGVGEPIAEIGGEIKPSMARER